MTNTTNAIKKGLTSLVAAATLVGAANAKAEDPIGSALKYASHASGHVETGYHSRYMGTFGFTLSNNEVYTEDVGINLNTNITAGVFANYDPKLGLNELDGYATGNFSLGKHLDFQPEMWYFSFPSINAEDAFTIAAGVKTKNLPKGLPDVKLYATQAFGEQSHDGNLFQVILTKGFTVPGTHDKLSINLEGRATYNNHYFVKGSGFTTLAAGASATYNFGKGYSASAGIRSQKAFNSLGGVFVDHAATFDFTFRKDF